MDRDETSVRHTSTPLGRRAGEYARCVQRRYSRQAVLAVVGMSAIALLIGVVLGLGWMTVGVEALLIAALLGIDRSMTPLIQRWGRGAAGEEQVGAILDGMRNTGWLALHDIATGRGNVDHVVVGPSGIFTIETKSHPGRINAGRIPPQTLKQAYAEGKFIEGITAMKVEPLLVFSRAYLSPAVTRRDGVVILPARMLPGHLARRRVTLSDQQVLELHGRLAAAVAP